MLACMRGDLNRAVEPVENLGSVFTLPARAVVEHHPRRRGAAPAAVIAQHRPEIAGFRLAAPGVQHWGGGLVDIEARAALFQDQGHVIHHRRDQRTGPTHPIGEDGSVDRHAVPGHNHGLTVQGHVLGMLGHGDLGQQRLGGPATLQKMRRRFGLNHTRAPLGAGVFRADRDDHLIARRDVIQPVDPVLTDPHHVAATAWADAAVRLDDTLDARQVFRQGARLALLARRLLLGIGLAGRDLRLDRGNLFLGLGDGRFQILQRQFELRGVQLLGFRAELRMPVLSDLAFQLLDQGLQLGDEGVLLSPNRLFMQAGRTLDRGFKPCCFQRRSLCGKGLHHLGRKVWKLVEIEGLRHTDL